MKNLLKSEINYILSDSYLNFVIKNEKWCHHGSHILKYFDYEDLVLEYANSKERKQILKKYIQTRLNEILTEFEVEKPEFLYRALYLENKPKFYDFFGYFWSSDEKTNACVKLNTKPTYLLKISFDFNIIDWQQTLMSRMDFVFGEKEKEYYLKNENVSLIDYFQI